jgi:hypothetical protein
MAGPAGLAALRSAALRRRPAASAPPSGTYRRGGRVKKAAGGASRAWGETDKSAEDLPKPVERKAKGGVTRKRPAGPKVSIAVVTKKRPMPPPAPDDEDDVTSTPPPAAVPPAGGMAKGGKWIQGAIKHPGALHKQLGVPQGEKIPAAKLAKAASKSGKLGQRARLAQTLKGMHKAKGGVCKQCGKAHGGACKMAKGGKFNSTKAAPGNLPTHPGAKKMAAGGAAKERKGFPNTMPPPKKGYASGGKVRGGGAAQRGLHFSGIY